MGKSATRSSDHDSSLESEGAMCVTKERARAQQFLCTLPNCAPTRYHVGLAIWSRLLLVALFLLPAPALAGVKEKGTALAPSGLVLVMDVDGNELVAQNADEPFVPPQSPRS